MTRKGEFVLRQLADEYILIPYGTTTEKMNRVLTLSETAAFIYEQTGDAASEEEIARRLGEAYDVPAEDVQEDAPCCRHCKIVGFWSVPEKRKIIFVICKNEEDSI